MLKPAVASTASGSTFLPATRSIGCSTNSNPPSRLRFSNHMTRLSATEPPTMSTSPSPSRSTGWELIGQGTSVSGCSIQASPSSGAPAIWKKEISFGSCRARSGSCAPLFGVTTSSLPSSFRSARNTRMNEPRSSVTGGINLSHVALRLFAPGFSK